MDKTTSKEEALQRICLRAKHLVDWWKRYKQEGPTGGSRRLLAEAVEEYEKQYGSGPSLGQAIGEYEDEQQKEI